MTIQTKRSEPRFKDFYTNLDVHPVRGDLYVLEDADSIKTSLKNIIFTNPGERFFNPRFGSGIKKTLFENISSDTEYQVKVYIENAIRNFEPRVNLIEVYVTAVPDDNKYHVSIVYSIINSPVVETFNVLLSRVR